jgi:hypothetical protein
MKRMQASTNRVRRPNPEAEVRSPKEGRGPKPEIARRCAHEALVEGALQQVVLPGQTARKLSGFRPSPEWLTSEFGIRPSFGLRTSGLGLHPRPPYAFALWRGQ